MEVFLGCDEVVEADGDEGPHGIRVLEGDIAGRAEENEVFKCVKVGKVDNTTLLEVGELDRKVSLDNQYSLVERTHDGNISGRNDTRRVLPVKTTEPALATVGG